MCYQQSVIVYYFNQAKRHFRFQETGRETGRYPHYVRIFTRMVSFLVNFIHINDNKI